MKEERLGVVLILFLTIGVLAIFIVAGFVIMYLNDSILYFVWLASLIVYCVFAIVSLQDMENLSRG